MKGTVGPAVGSLCPPVMAHGLPAGAEVGLPSGRRQLAGEAGCQQLLEVSPCPSMAGRGEGTPGKGGLGGPL